jgi:hypothetical protein
MCLIARKRKFVYALLTVILCGGFFAVIAFADDEPKTTTQADEQAKKLYAATTETSTLEEPKRRALLAPLDPQFPSSEYLGPTPLIGVPDTDPEYPLEKVLWSAFPALKAHRINPKQYPTRFKVKLEKLKDIPVMPAIAHPDR